jgi:hypothetical protein
MLIKTWLCALAIAVSSPALADTGITHLPCGYQQLTSISSAKKLTIPASCGGLTTFARISVEDQAVRYRDDGVAPTASVGMPMSVGASMDYEGTISAIQFIEQTSGGIVNISYYR